MFFRVPAKCETYGYQQCVSMKRENMLTARVGSYTDRWKETETALWARSVQRLVTLAVIVGTVIRLSGEYLSGKSEVVTIGVTGVTLGLALHVRRVEVKEGHTNQLLFSGFLVVVQGYCLYVGTLVLQQYLVLWCMASSVIFCLFEVPSFLPRPWVFVLLIRQFLMWQVSVMYLQHQEIPSNFPYFMFGAVIAGVLSFTRENAIKTLEKYQLCDSIEEEKRKLRNILQVIPEGVAVIVDSLDIPCVNSQLLTLLNPPNMCLMDSLNSLSCANSLETVSLKTEITDFLQAKSESQRTFGVTEHGERDYEWKGTKCVWGEEVACILTATEITKWMQAKEKLEAESEAKSAMLRFVSHELRTPTNAILNLTSTVLQSDNLSPSQRTSLSIVSTSTSFLLSVINDLLDFSRLAAQKFSLVKTSFDIRKKLQEAVDLVELQCTQKGLYVKLNVDLFVPDVVYTDPNRLKQVLLNLLGNAVKFTFQGGIRVICMATEQNHLKITVKDTGIGIPPAKISSLCTAFSMVDGQQSINPQGCGLGLYISNLLVKCLGSKPIEINSTEHLGSEFSFEVAICDEYSVCVSDERGDFTSVGIEDERSIESILSAKECIGGKGENQGELPVVLIVEDSEFNRVVLGKMMEMMNVRADQVNTGVRALRVIREEARRGHLYRLVLMDVEMPEMDGITTAKEIRAMELTGELTEGPVIVACSAHRGTDEYARCIHAGMNDCIEKPISKAKLQEILRFLPLGSVSP